MYFSNDCYMCNNVVYIVLKTSYIPLRELIHLQQEILLCLYHLTTDA